MAERSTLSRAGITNAYQYSDEALRFGGVRLPLALVSAGGSPSGAVQLLVRQLLDSGAHVRYHGDFDTTGLVLCARMAAVGVDPWRTTAVDDEAALAAADARGVRLLVEQVPPPPTPWDPELHDVFASKRRIVHEERLLPGLLDG